MAGRAGLGHPARMLIKREAEAAFAHRVDVPVPPFGLGQRLNHMRAWCRDRCGRDWAQHHHSEGRLNDFARFYFSRPEDAAAFRERWRELL